MSSRRIALVVDGERLRHEGPAIGRIVKGLVERERTVIALISPEDADVAQSDPTHPLANVRRVETPLRVLPWVRRHRAEKVATALGRTAPDIAYVVGADAWDLGLELGRHLDRPVVVDAWSTRLARRPRRGRDASGVAAWTTPTRPIAAILRQRVAPETVAVVPVGVPIPPEPHPILTGDRPLAVAIIGPGESVDHHRAVLEALARLAQDGVDFNASVELAGPRGHDIWRMVGKLDLEGRVAPTGDASHFRQLLATLDLMLLPEPTLDFRSLVLEAMAAGTLVVGVRETVMDVLRDGETARSAEPSAEGWLTALRGALDDPAATRVMGLAGRAAVEATHGVERQIDGLAAVLDRVVDGDALPFAT